jgi:hypothetical protein
MLSDRNGPHHLYKQPLDQVQPELLVGGDEMVGIPRLAPSGNEVLYLQMPRSRASGEPVKIMRVQLSGGVPQEIVQAPGTWNYQCAQPPAKLCLYSPTDPNKQRFFAFDIGRVKVRYEDQNLCFLAGIPSPDGHHLPLPVTSPNSSNVWLMENF